MKKKGVGTFLKAAAAIYADRLAGDVPGLLREEKSDQGSNFSG